MTIGILTPLQMIAGAALSNNSGVNIANTWTAADNAYTGTDLLSPFFAAVANSSAANISANTLTSMFTFCANTVPALADNTPSAYASLGTNTTAGFTGIVTSQGQSYLGNGNISIFAQVFTAAEGYITSSNDYINTAVNSQTYLGSTFTTMNSLITGNLTDATLATEALGQDLSNVSMIGELRLWSGTIATIPTGFLHCDGSAISRTTYAAL